MKKVNEICNKYRDNAITYITQWENGLISLRELSEQLNKLSIQEQIEIGVEIVLSKKTDCNDVYEVCPECECEVELKDAKLKTPQKCPNCGKYIMPCSLCYDCDNSCGWQNLNRITGKIEKENDDD